MLVLCNYMYIENAFGILVVGMCTKFANARPFQKGSAQSLRLGGSNSAPPCGSFCLRYVMMSNASFEKNKMSSTLAASVITIWSAHKMQGG